MTHKVTILLTAHQEGGFLLETTEHKSDEKPVTVQNVYFDFLKALVALTTAKRKYLSQPGWQIEVYDAIRNKITFHTETAREAAPPAKQPFHLF